MLFFKVTNRDVHVQLNDQWYYAVFSEVCREQCARQCFQYMYTCTVYSVQCAACRVWRVECTVCEAVIRFARSLALPRWGARGEARAWERGRDASFFTCLSLSSDLVACLKKERKKRDVAPLLAPFLRLPLIVRGEVTSWCVSKQARKARRCNSYLQIWNYQSLTDPLTDYRI